jgi:hypothetical protein
MYTNGLQKCKNNYCKNLTDENGNTNCHEGDEGLGGYKRSQRLDHAIRLVTLRNRENFVLAEKILDPQNTDLK